MIPRHVLPVRQRGLSLIGAILFAALVVVVAMVLIKVSPAVIEYYSVMRHAKSVAGSREGQSIYQVREAFLKRLSSDGITGINPSDMEISKDRDELVIDVSYSRKVQLYGPVSLMIDFTGSTGRVK